jgi:ADP-ribose pyrophosphatase YjhB (NUDIX family)
MRKPRMVSFNLTEAQMIKNHFTATGVVFNAGGKVLMIKHKKLGVWLPPGGHVEENELPDHAVIREIREETGVTAEIIDTKLLGILGNNCLELARPFVVLLEDIEGDGMHNHIDLIYICRAVSDTLEPHEAEVDGIGWFTPEEVAALDTFDNVRKTVAAAVRYIY